MKTPPTTVKRLRGFSLLEVLVVIVVIGAITAIAVPVLMNVKEEARTNATRRTAQIVSSTAANAQMAGNSSIAEAATKEDAIATLSSGVFGGGVFDNVKYRVALSPSEETEVANYLEFVNGALLFNPQL